jgi:DNA-binding SARP family transcriptional activator/TolB-like protein
VTSTRRQHSVSSAASAPATAAPFVIRTLGELRVDGPAGTVRGLRRKERLLLAFLARTASPVPRARLGALLWGRAPDARAKHSLRQAIFALRQVLGDGLDVGADAVGLRAGAVDLDVALLEAELAAGRPGAALAWWHGEFLAGLEDAGDEPLREWIDAERAALQRLLAAAHAQLAAAARRAPDVRAAALPLLRQWAEANAAEEAAQLQLIEVLRAAGRLAEAAAWHRRAAERLAAVSGRAPSAAFVAVERSLLHTTLSIDAAADLPAAVSEEAWAAWQAARDGGGGVLRVHGAGTRALCAALAARVAAAPPSLVLRLAHDAVHVNAAEAWSAAALLLAPLRAARGLSGASDAALAEVAALVPSIRERFPQLPPARGGEDGLGVAAIETIRDVAVETPLLVCVDDIACCDAATCRWLERLAAELPPYVLLAIGDAAAARRDAPPLPAPSPPAKAIAMPPAASLGSRLRRRLRRLTRWSLAALAAALAALVLAGAALLHAQMRFGPTPVLAVGAMNVLGADAADAASMALPELISTQLARVDRLEVVSRQRMQEVRAQAAGDLAAARLAGATELLEGELYRRGERYHLELRRLDTRSGRVRGTYSVEAEHALDLAHGIATAVARRLGRAVPPASYVPGSVAARALYEAGLQAFYHRQDFATALRLFRDALAEDPDFAMAALFAARSAAIVEGHEATSALLQRAEAAADLAPERDRLFILASTALHFSDPAGLEHARQLAHRYAADPAGPLLLGLFLGSAGRFDEAIVELRRSLAMQPPTPDAPSTFCSACEAYATLIQTHWAADSLGAAMRVASEWAARQPRNPDPLVSLATLQLLGGRYDDALATRERATRLLSGRGSDVLWIARSSAYRGDFAAADAGLAYLVDAGDAGLAREALWLQFITFREQRRAADAWRAATRLRALVLGDGPASHPYATPQAVLLMEGGAPALAAALFDTMYHQLGDLGRGSRTARDGAWLLTLRAAALAAAGDTALLPALADEIERLGARSLYARDTRLHHHVRGLLLRARGDRHGAAGEFRSAIYSTTAGYTRTNVELARVLLELGRADEAVPLLHAALRAPLDGPALYVTRHEVRELLDRATHGAAGAAPAAADHVPRGSEPPPSPRIGLAVPAPPR